MSDESKSHRVSAAAYWAAVGLAYWIAHRYSLAASQLGAVLVVLSVCGALWIWGAGWRTAIGICFPRRLPASLGLAAVLVGCAAYALMGAPASAALGLGVVFAALVTAIAEELVFRGVLLGWLVSRISPGRALVVSAVVFGVGHWFRVVRGQDAAELGMLVGIATALGVVFGAARLRSGSLIPGIGIHAAWNVWAVCAAPMSESAASAHPVAVGLSVTAIVLAGLALSVSSVPRFRAALGIAGCALLSLASSWFALREVDPDRTRHAALVECANWGVVDLADFANLKSRGSWAWAPGDDESEPRDALEQLLRADALGYLARAAQRDPAPRLRVAAAGLLRRTAVDPERRPRDGDAYREFVSTLFEALQQPASAGPRIGPDVRGLRRLVREVLQRDSKWGGRMTRSLLAELPRVDSETAWVSAQVLHGLPLPPGASRAVLSERLYDDGESNRFAYAYLLEALGPGADRAAIMRALEERLVSHPDSLLIESALERVRTEPDR